MFFSLHDGSSSFYTPPLWLQGFRVAKHYIFLVSIPSQTFARCILLCTGG